MRLVTHLFNSTRKSPKSVKYDIIPAPNMECVDICVDAAVAHLFKDEPPRRAARILQLQERIIRAHVLMTGLMELRTMSEAAARGLVPVPDRTKMLHRPKEPA